MILKGGYFIVSLFLEILRSTPAVALKFLASFFLKNYVAVAYAAPNYFVVSSFLEIVKCTPAVATKVFSVILP